MRFSRRLGIALSALALVVVIGCSVDNHPTAPSSPAPAPSPLLVGGILDGLGKTALSPLLTCTPQPYAADTAVIGPAGGKLTIGRHTLVVPAGALNETVQIIGDAPVDKVVSVRFQPEGLQFNPARKPRLTLDYSSCGLVRNLTPKRVAYTTESLDILSMLLSVDDLLKRQVSTNLEHFSRYAVAY